MRFIFSILGYLFVPILFLMWIIQMEMVQEYGFLGYLGFFFGFLFLQEIVGKIIDFSYKKKKQD